MRMTSHALVVEKKKQYDGSERNKRVLISSPHIQFTHCHVLGDIK